MCLCPDCTKEVLIDGVEPSHTEHDEDCDCQDCENIREAARDRDFDEQVALGYPV